VDDGASGKEEDPMAKPRSLKRDIDLAKRDKAARKRERRQRAGEESTGEESEATDGGTATNTGSAAAPSGATQAELLEALSVLHARFDAGEIDLEEFEEVKADLLARVAVA
jgi:Short C-terminal domain